MKLVVLAAGKGTRFYPLTKTIPKGLIPIKGRPLLEYVLESYIENISEILFVINDELGTMIKSHFGSMYKNVPISYVKQKETDQKGTFSALLLCKELIGEDMFCVSNCDDLLLKEDIKNALTEKIPGIGISQATMPWNYLGIDVDEYSHVSGFRKHSKEQGQFVQDVFSNGFHILTSAIFNFEPMVINGGEVGLPQTLFKNLETYPLKAYMFKKWQAVNGPENIKDAEMFIEKCM